jgi:LmbE family N-acetylglucosaminyl deacetylase
MRVISFLSLSVIFFMSLTLYPHAYAEDLKSDVNITENDRILILAPHPDDETIGTCGVIQEALKQNAKVKVVCYTNGDSNELAFIVYEKRITFRKGEFLHMGEVRRKETVQAMVSLGLKQTDLAFLGYPDFGTLEIFTKYWGDVTPYKSMLPRVSKVSYPEAMSPDAPYVGDSILKDIEKIILNFRPTKIFVSHPGDTNRDHKSLYLFTQVALWDLEGKIKPPQVLPYIIHVVRWPLPRGYHPDITLEPPASLAGCGIAWHSLKLTDEEIKTKRNTTSFYRSQNASNPKYLFTFSRSNELFGDFPALKLNSTKKDSGEIDWQDLEVRYNPEAVDPENKKDAENSIVPDTAYAVSEAKLLVRFQLKRNIAKDLGVSIFLIGYNYATDFSKMPKLYIRVDSLGLHVTDKKKPIEVKDIEIEAQDHIFILKVPLRLLGDPDRIFSCARTHPNELPLDEISWRVLYLEKEK